MSADGWVGLFVGLAAIFAAVWIFAKNQKKSRYWTIPTALGCGLCIAAALFIAIRDIVIPPPPLNWADFDAPAEDAEVTSPIVVTGSAGLAEGQELWLLSKAPNGNYYTTTSNPSPIDIDARGDWTVRDVGIGKDADDIGNPYELVLVATPSEGSEIEDEAQDRDSMSANLGKRLPEDAEELDRVLVTLGGFHQSPTDAPPSPSSESNGAPIDSDGQAILRFNSLGGGSPYISVFPGVEDKAEDRIANGSFEHGQTAPALCQTRGRLVVSDTNAGEQSRESDIWVRISGSPNVVQYASLTYGEIEDGTPEGLPRC